MRLKERICDDICIIVEENPICDLGHLALLYLPLQQRVLNQISRADLPHLQWSQSHPMKLQPTQQFYNQERYSIR